MDTSMKQDIHLITTFDLLVVNRFISFTVNPSNIQQSIFELAIKMFDKSHSPVDEPNPAEELWL